MTSLTNKPVIGDINLADLSAEDVERLWQRLQDQRAAREAAPELYHALRRRIDEAVAEGTVTTEQADAIRAEMAWCHPVVVLQAHWREIVRDRKALGAFPRAHPKPWDADVWLRANPSTHLAAVVREMARFTSDTRRVVEGALELADRAGIEPTTANAIIANAIKTLPKRRGARAG